MNEADLFNTILMYGELSDGRFEFFMGGTIAMIIAIFISGYRLNVYLRAMVIIIYSSFTYTQMTFMNQFNSRIFDGIESIKIITSDQIDRLPLSQSLLDAPITGFIGTDFSTMLLAWAGCVVLMAFPKFINSETK